MPKVVATDTWSLPFYKVPGVGLVRKPVGIVQLSDRATHWLESRGYVRRQAGESVSSIPPDELPIPAELPLPELPRLEIKVEPPPAEPEISPVKLEAWQELALEFFNTAADSSTISSAINGIGPARAGELIDGRPLDWEAVKSILNTTTLRSTERYFSEAG